MLSQALRTFVLLILFLGFSFASKAETGSHGGQLQSLHPYLGSSLLPGHSVELVEETETDSKKRFFRIYLVGSNSDSLNLMSVGYWAVQWRVGKKNGRLEDDLKKEKERVWKEKEPYTPIYSFVASGKIPDDPELILEIAIALPGKGGTGIASFNGVNPR